MVEEIALENVVILFKGCGKVVPPDRGKRLHRFGGGDAFKLCVDGWGVGVVGGVFDLPILFTAVHEI